MDSIYKRSLALVAMLLATTLIFAQTTVSGTVKDEDGEALPGANILVDGTTVGTVSDSDGKFQFTTDETPPFKLKVTFIGYRTMIVDYSGSGPVDLVMTLDALGLDEVVILGPGSNAAFISSPVLGYRAGIQEIRSVPAPDFYEAISYQPGVQMNAGSLNFQAMNTRGFATIANTRFVQQLDGMDTSAPILNFPTGNIVGISELDAESMDILPGASSALYGPNAFNGIIIMTSKSPFEYEGLSVTAKAGMTNSDARGEAEPLYNFGLRYGRKIGEKFAFKFNFSYSQATDWIGNDYVSHRPTPESTVDQSNLPYFDGLNLYGDETVINVPIPGFSPITRTGFKEEDIIDNYDASSMKYDAALHYRITPDLELSYSYRFGGGNTVYQGSEKYAIRDFTQRFHKVELKGKSFFIRAYNTRTDAGDSYNMSALGALANEAYSPSATNWVPDYIVAYYGAIPSVPAGNHDAARAFADRNRPQVGTAAFNNLIETVRNQYFQRNPPGAKFIDESRLYHTEFNYRMDDVITFAEVQIGGNFRRYDLFSDATVYNEDADGDGTAEGIVIDEYGAYLQIAKEINKLKLTGSIRHDKNQNFDGLWTPRFSAVYGITPEHYLRASFQTGFRNPDTQAQYIYFPTGSGILLGSTKDNAEQYGVHEGGAYTQSSFENFRQSGGTIDPATGTVTGPTSLLETADISYIKPEKLQSFEIGYKGSFNNSFLIDAYAFYNQYENFIGDQLVYSKNPTTHKGQPVGAGTLWSPYVNSTEEVTSFGSGINLSYTFLKGFVATANYTYQTYDANEDEFIAGFNTPENRIVVGLSNRNINKTGFGFNINYRWQEAFLWNSGFGNWIVPEYGVFDAQVNYKIKTMKATVKLGGTNLIGGDYRPNFGSSFVGSQYFLSVTFDDLFK